MTPVPGGEPENPMCSACGRSLNDHMDQQLCATGNALLNPPRVGEAWIVAQFDEVEGVWKPM